MMNKLLMFQIFFVVDHGVVTFRNQLLKYQKRIINTLRY